MPRPYEEAIIAAMKWCLQVGPFNTLPDVTAEPFAGLARGSRTLLDKGLIRHAFLNDLEPWPDALLGASWEVPEEEIGNVSPPRS